MINLPWDQAVADQVVWISGNKVPVFVVSRFVLRDHSGNTFEHRGPISVVGAVFVKDGVLRECTPLERDENLSDSGFRGTLIGVVGFTFDGEWK